MSAQVVRRLPFHQPSAHLLGARNHESGTRIDRSGQGALPSGLGRERLSLRGLRAPVRARSRRGCTPSSLENSAWAAGSTHTRLGAGEASQYTPRRVARSCVRRHKGPSKNPYGSFSNSLAIARSGQRNSWWQVQGPMKPEGICRRSVQVSACAATGSASRSSGPRKIIDQRISPMACLLGGGKHLFNLHPALCERKH